MITAEFAEKVRELREQGHSWRKTAKLAGRPVRTCQRAIGVGQPGRECAHSGCSEPALMSGRYCSEHAKNRMRNKPGQGDRQKEVMRHMRRLGYATTEELRTLTGLGSDHLGQVLGRLVKLGMIERPMMGHYCMPRAPEFVPEAPILPTPDAQGHRY